jgi:hypothetical protein
MAKRIGGNVGLDVVCVGGVSLSASSGTFFNVTFLLICDRRFSTERVRGNRVSGIFGMSVRSVELMTGLAEPTRSGGRIVATS